MIVVYNKYSGDIEYTIEGPNLSEQNLKAHQDVLETSDKFRSCDRCVDLDSGELVGKGKYIDGDTEKDKEKIELEKTTVKPDGEDSIVIKDLPKCRVIFDGEENIVEDGEVEITADSPGSYRLTIQAYPYETLQTTVEAEDD